jgi:pyruvate-ferredoxin/flavodoxin oxidoreductase
MFWAWVLRSDVLHKNFGGEKHGQKIDGEPLYTDVCSVLMADNRQMTVVGGRYGLGSKEFTPSMVKAIFDNLLLDEPKNHFTVGIVDDVTGTSLEVAEYIDTAPKGVYRCKFFGLGSDGTVGANKNSIKIIGDNTDMYAQGYFVYDSKKSGGITISHLRFGHTPIKSPYLIDQADLIACHNPSYVSRYDILDGIKEGGVFLLNSGWSLEDMGTKIPASVRRTIARRKLRFFNIDAVRIAGEVGLGGRINMVMQAAFFKIANVISPEDAIKYIKDAIKATYGRKGDKVVNMNYAAVDKAIEALEEIQYPAEWADAVDEPVEADDAPDYIKKVVRPILDLKGDELPVSIFAEDGTVPTGTTKYEKRGVAIQVPAWDADKCIQCNQCAFVCPHAAIRPYLAKSEDLENAPEGFVTKKAVGKDLAGLQYRMQLSPLDCTGCGNCIDVCLAKEKALIMKPFEEVAEVEAANWEFAEKLPDVKTEFNTATVKGSQFLRPLFEFSGACAGCGETPYVKLVTQLFGDRMIVANATGCSSIYGGSAPTCPYTVNSDGHGPAWANSLFEDNAEFGYGMSLAVQQKRNELAGYVKTVLEAPIGDELKEALEMWLDNMNDPAITRETGEKIKSLGSIALEDSSCSAKDAVAKILELSEYLVKKSVWIFGGDGWAYDIGYGGLDHVLASGQDVNVLVLDTEVYSNTGGQASKATPLGAVAKFAASGKKTGKKDLGLMAMAYGYVYVASVSMGANRNQLLKALIEAEKYDGPSLVIAYAPCINHGINMSKSQEIGKKAVESGYWPLYRYNPELTLDGKNPFALDSKDPSESFQEFILGQVRYSSLKKQFPEKAEVLYEKAEKDAKARLERYKSMIQE